MQIGICKKNLIVNLLTKTNILKASKFSQKCMKIDFSKVIL